MPRLAEEDARIDLSLVGRHLDHLEVPDELDLDALQSPGMDGA